MDTAATHYPGSTGIPIKRALHDSEKNKVAELPPTPSSSSYMSSAADLATEKEHGLSSRRPILYHQTSSLAETKPYMLSAQTGLMMPSDSDTTSVPSTPPHTTVSPDGDESLYLLWTDQILRNHGLRPQSYRTISFDHEGDEIDDDDNSSLTEASSLHQRHHRSNSTWHTWRSMILSPFSLCMTAS
ncbi:hypothetical protein BCR43DRAFT_513780 [Syncephalastrum racemosum]|uniref:Uncharacterized protein n=1 Tax=Syncephalastrum racemosum TaxID=13706 RepID=A0A1X2HEL3_SYNRA|nr:hypothetical protein BCR43DRAFT_513780 [Syncephalastrum racemosum]